MSAGVLAKEERLRSTTLESGDIFCGSEFEQEQNTHAYLKREVLLDAPSALQSDRNN